MKITSNILQTRKTGNILALLVVLLILLFALIRLYPFENTLGDVVLSEADDWGVYAKQALEIKHHSFWIASVNENYFAPAGFLYNYFIAACFYVFGDNIIPIYIIQNLLLGLSAVFIFMGFRDKMQPVTGLVFLLTLFIFSLLDVFKDISFRLLSENLGLFTVSAFFLCFIKGIEKNKLSLQITSAVLLGLSVLSRPNIFPFAVILILILIYVFIKQKRTNPMNLFLFIFSFGLCMTFLLIRNHLICGTWTFLPTAGTVLTDSLVHSPVSFSYFFKKALFCLGILTPVDPHYQWRPHWILMWLGYFIYLFLRMREKRKPELWEITAHVFIASYYGLLILIAQIGSYGFRQLIPATFIVLAFSFMAMDRLLIQKFKSGL